MTRDEGIHLPVGKRQRSQESLLKYDADAVAMGPRANCWRRYGRERIASFEKGPPYDAAMASGSGETRSLP